MNDLNPLDSVRVDKWLWSVRICKTRALALTMCKQGKVEIDGLRAKPSRAVRAGQNVDVKWPGGLTRQFRVLQCIDGRVGAKLAAECKEEVTPQEDLDQWQIARRSRAPSPPKGQGRPTKKDRRKLDSLWDT